jgi:3-isopropylmalate dehydrogenase
MTRRRRYTIACLAGDGIGPEVMAEASRAVHAVSRLHGFLIDEVHVPFGTEARTRSGQLLPLPTRLAYLQADAVLVAAAREETLEDVETELDLRAAVTRLRFGSRATVSLLSPLIEDAAEWTIERAFAIACSSRGRVASVYGDRGWRDLLEEVAGRHDGVIVEHVRASSALSKLAFEPEGFDVVVTGPRFADALAGLASLIDRPALIVASGRLAGNGAGIFAPVHDAAPEIAGQGVANPSSMLLAAALMLGEGLGERAAAETLAGAISAACSNGIRTADMVGSGVAATTREFADVVLEELPSSVTNAEFLREAWA